MARPWEHFTTYACALVLLAGVGAIPASAQGSGPFSPTSATRVATVELSAIAGVSSGRSGHLRAPFLSPPQAASNRAGGAQAPVIDQSATSTSTQTTTSSPALTELAAFPVMSLDGQINAFGSGQNVTPPDTQIAAGPTYLLEAINDSGSVWSKTGGLVKTFDLDVFFHVPSGSLFSDPRVLYDAPTGRWFMSGLSFTPPSYGSVVYLAVSSGSDPTGTWTVYSADSQSNILHDQPKIGVSADKVVMSWNDFQNGSTFIGETTYVWQKSQLLSASSSVAIQGVVDDGSRNSLVPAQALAYASTDTNAYVVWNDSHCFLCSPSIGVLTVTGTPMNGNVAWTESDLGIPATSSPPSADQPGAAGSIATNDDRFLTAVVQAGTLWTSGNDACVPSGDSTTRPCPRFIAVSTAGPTISQDFDLGSAGTDLYYPAVGLDQSSDLFATYAISSTSLYPGVRVIAESGGSILAGQTVKVGEALYNDSPCYGINPPSRWGDFSAAAVDPSATGDVWLGGEYAATSTLSSTNGCAWGTYAAEFTVGSSSSSAPPVASVSPTSIAFGNQPVGTTSSAQTVTVTNTGGSDLTIPKNGVVLSGSAEFTISSNSCSNTSTTTTVAAGGSCSFAVAFAPSSVGSVTGTVDIYDNATGSPQAVALSGSGVKRGHH